MLSGVASGTTDGADVDYGRDWRPYVTLRGGWVFGKMKNNIDWTDANGRHRSIKENLKHAWSGSCEFGIARWDEKISVGLEFGYFTGKTEGKERFNIPADINGRASFELGNLFGACNGTLRYHLGERCFLYGGAGAGMARVAATGFWSPDDNMRNAIGAQKWCFLGQGFTGVGVRLNDSLSLNIGYRLRYLSGSPVVELNDGADTEWFRPKQNLIHAAEVGVTYWFWIREFSSAICGKDAGAERCPRFISITSIPATPSRA